jgi:8-amino-7-oxononanoate synthase
LGKALGGFGAFIAAPKKIIDFLRNSTRSYIYTTALPPALAAATRASLHLLKNNDGAHSQLHKNIAYFKEKIQHTSLKFLESDSAIHPLLLESNERALRWSQFLYTQGFWVSAIRPPTVPINQARLRITLSANHSLQNINDLIHALLLCQQQEGA